MKKSILHIALLTSLLTYNFWTMFPKGFFYVGNAFFVFLLCCYLYLTEKKSFIKFVLFALSLNNLFDEVFFTNTETHVHEYITAVLIIIIGLKKEYNDRKRTNHL